MLSFFAFMQAEKSISAKKNIRFFRTHFFISDILLLAKAIQ